MKIIASEELQELFEEIDLAKHPIDQLDETHRDDKKLVLSKVFELAKSFWQSGYSPDQIVSMLQKHHFEDSVISAAMNQVKSYATEVLSTGPFHGFVNVGQKIRLKTGTYVVANRIVDNELIASAGEDTYKVTMDDIDTNATKLLHQAHLIRLKAMQILGGPKEYKLPEPIAGPEMEVSPEPEESYKKVWRETGAPPGWGDIAPEIGDTDPVSPLLAKIINNLVGLEEMTKELNSKIKTTKNTYLDPLYEELKGLKAEEQLELKNLFMAVEQMNEGLDAIDKTVFRDYENQIVGFQKKLIEEAMPPDMEAELNALKQILQENHERIAGQVFKALEEYMQANTTITKRIENIFAKFKYRKNPLKKDSQLLTKLTSWIKGVWEHVQQATSDLYGSLDVVDESVDAIQYITERMNSETKAVAAKKLAAGYCNKLTSRY